MGVCLRRAMVAAGGLAMVAACSPPPRMVHFPASSTVAATPLDEILVLDSEHDALVIVKRDSGERETVPLGGTPGFMTVTGINAIITLPYDRTVLVVSLPDRRIAHRVQVGVEPQGVAPVGPGLVGVVLSGERALATVDTSQGLVVQKFPLDLEMPYGIGAMGGDRVLVTDRVRPMVARLDVEAGTVERVELQADTQTGVQVPTLMHSITAAPAFGDFLVPNVMLTRAPDGTVGFSQETNSVQVYYGPKPTPAVAMTVMNGPGSSSWDLFKHVADTESLSEPVAMALLDGESAVAVLFRGTRRLVVWQIDGFTGKPCAAPLASIRVGHGADGITASPDGNRLFIRNATDLTVTMIDVPNLRSAGTCVAAPGATFDAETVAYAENDIPEDVLEGRRLFYDGTNSHMTTVGITCAYCHVDGRSDNRTWLAPKGIRNTPSLAGAAPGQPGIADTAPYHWDGEFASQTEMNQTVTLVMNGEGMNDDESGKIFRYIDTLRKPDHVLPADEETNALIARGREIFNDTTVGCSRCHAGTHFTDSQNHDVGTGDDGLFQTPVLTGLSRTAPYLHNGSIPSLDQLVAELVATDKMGVGSHLSKDDLRALTFFLRSL